MRVSPRPAIAIAAHYSPTGAARSSTAGLHSTVTLALAAAASLLDSRAFRAPAVRRVETGPREARALSREPLRALQRETDRLPSSRDCAVVQLLMLTGVRIGEPAELEVDDVRLTQRTGELIIHPGGSRNAACGGGAAPPAVFPASPWLRPPTRGFFP